MNIWNKQVFDPGKRFRSCLVFASKAGAYLSEACFGSSPLRYAPGLTLKD